VNFIIYIVTTVSNSILVVMVRDLVVLAYNGIEANTKVVEDGRSM
jgi:hypothetical protein